MRQPLQYLEIESEAERAPEVVPKLINHIHLQYMIYGEADPAKAEKAISLSIDTYCTVSKMMDGIAKITNSRVSGS